MKRVGKYIIIMVVLSIVSGAVIIRHYNQPFKGPYAALTPKMKLDGFLRNKGIVVNLAHAGISHFDPHDTIPAFERALELGCDGVELDVVTCKSGEVIVHHDFTFEKTLGIDEHVLEKPLKEIQSLKLKLRHPQHLFTNARISSLEEVLKKFGNKMIIFIEIKHDDGKTYGAEEKVARLILKYGLSDTTLISSFELTTIGKLAYKYPQINTVQELYHLPEDYKSWYPEASYPFTISLKHDAVTPGFMAWAKNKFMGISSFTPNEKDDLERLVKMGVTMFQTDRPRRLANILNKREKAKKQK